MFLVVLNVQIFILPGTNMHVYLYSIGAAVQFSFQLVVYIPSQSPRTSRIRHANTEDVPNAHIFLPFSGAWL